MRSIKSHLIASAASLAILSATATPAFAQAPQNFNVPGGSLADALTSFGQQTDTNLVYGSALVDGLSTKGVSGTLSPRDALAAMLDGTNLHIDEDTSGALVIVRDETAAQSPQVQPAAAEEPAAQVTPAAAPLNDEELTQDTIIVVGSQIVGSQVDGALPVTVVGDEDIAAIGSMDGDDLLRSIPQMGDVGFNSTENVSGGVNSARGDVASINLRALGTGNTLTLLNGRRMVNHPGTQSENLVPVVTVNANAIPVTGVKRVEVLLDGAAALYGSDAVAGVVNTVLKDDFEGLTAGMRYGLEEGTSASEINFNFQAGQNFNAGRTNISLFGNYTKRDPVFASDRPFSAEADLRDRLPDSWAGDTQFRNTSTNTAWGAFTLLDPNDLSQEVNLPTVTNTGTGFHIQPDDFAGCRVDLGDGICIDDSNSSGSIPERYNVNDERTVSNGVERLNLFTTLHHDLENGMELYGEAGWYSASSKAQRAGSAQLTAGQVVIPTTNYYNPFGPVGSPNRIEGIGTPTDGLAVLLRRYRVVDAGPRRITVDNDSWRALMGLKGEYNNWDWDTALLYSEAEVDDTTTRISNTLFEQAISLDTPDAYNPFNGGGLPLSDTGDGTPSSDAAINSFIVPVSRVSSTSLALWDFKVSRPDLFSMWAGDIGAAFGVELRRETYKDDRDPRLDGTISFFNGIDADGTSDVMGSSPTLDSKGSRNVTSAFAEFAVPLLSPEMDIPLAQSIDMQLAVRYEDYDLFGSVTKPKVALAWRPSDFLLIRSAWSQGFKAPNLQQQFDRALERVNNREDYIQCEADLRAGRIASFSDCAQTDAVVSQRQGSTELGPEESENFTVGGVLDFTFIPEEYGRLQLTADYWQVEQEDVVGIFGDDNHLVLDYLLRVQGSSNPAVVRADPTAQDIADFAGTGLDPAGQILYVEDNYKNLLPREVEGIDYGLYYDLDDTRWGDFGLKLNVAQLKTFTQAISPIEASILAAQDAGTISNVATLSGVGDLIRQDGRPEWRWSLSANWENEAWAAGWFTSFVDDVLDTSATNDDTGEFWTVDSHVRHNAYVQYTMEANTDYPLQLRVGARNIFDEDPPLADEAFGYLGSLHSAQGRFLYFSARKTF